VGFIMGLFKKKVKYKALLNLTINAKLQPMNRDAVFEDMLNNVLKRIGCGYVDGGGTLYGGEGKEIDNCDVDIFLTEDSEDTRERLLKVLHALSPKGSILSEEGKAPILLGSLEGYAIYLNGTEISDEVYKTTDTKEVVKNFQDILGDELSYFSWWQGATETALYFYGKSYDTIKQKTDEFVRSYPLCQKCRIVKLPDELPH
jgi:hypothetical protein